MHTGVSGCRHRSGSSTKKLCGPHRPSTKGGFHWFWNCFPIFEWIVTKSFNPNLSTLPNSYHRIGTSSSGNESMLGNILGPKIQAAPTPKPLPGLSPACIGRLSWPGLKLNPLNLGKLAWCQQRVQGLIFKFGALEVYRYYAPILPTFPNLWLNPTMNHTGRL